MRKFFAAFCIAAAIGQLAVLGVQIRAGNGRALLAGGCTLPLTHTYTSGSGSEPVCTNAKQLIVEIEGGGADGELKSNNVVGAGGGGGGYSKKTLTGPFAAGTISYSVAALVAGLGVDACGLGNNGNATTAGGSGQLVNMTANGGAAPASTGTGGLGGTASGGDTNTTGSAGQNSGNGGAGAAPLGGAASSADGNPPGGGGGGQQDKNVTGCDAGNSGFGGARGVVMFEWQ